jgi:hypothetical protein
MAPRANTATVGQRVVPVVEVASMLAVVPRAATSAYPALTNVDEAAEAFHYSFTSVLDLIRRHGLRAGSYATPAGRLSPIQAQIDLALPANRGLRDAVIRIDLAGLRKAGFEIPEITPVTRNFRMPGGGQEMQFPYPVPPEFLTIVSP